jgi:hypothetical protein
MLPGTLLTRDWAATIFKNIERELGGSTARAWQPLHLEAALAWLERLPYEECYLYYRHPVHEFKDRCARSTKDAALRFLKESFNKERGEGLDLYLTPLDFGVVLAGNHDGDLFRAK